MSKRNRNTLVVGMAVQAAMSAQPEWRDALPQTEVRTYAAAELRIIEPADGEKMPKLAGYAAVFGVASRPMGKGETRFVEVIKKGAFGKALANGADVRALWDHETASVLGRTKSGTLKLWEDDKGLRFECQPPDTQVGRDAVSSIRRGDVDGMSFGFRKISDEWSKNSDGMMVRTLIEIEPFDVSPTAFPAYEGTDIDLRSIPGAVKAINKLAGKIVLPPLPEQERRDLSVTTDANVADRCMWVRYQCRSTFDSLASLIDQLGQVEGDPNDSETQAINDLQDEMEDLCEKLADADAACVALVGEDDPSPEEEEAIRKMESARRRLALIDPEYRAGHMTHADASPSLNADAVNAAKDMIKAGKVDDGEWSFTAADEDKLLGSNRWDDYAKWFLSIDKNADDESKAAYKYPFGKDGRVYVRALNAIRSRASKQSAKPIYDAAGELLDLIKPKDDSK